MSKLGYTWYPKDFISDPDVMMMSPEDRGIYRDLIDLAYLNDNVLRYSIEQLAKYCNSGEDGVKKILEQKGVKRGKYWSIPSCKKRIKKANTARENGLSGGRGKNPERTQKVTGERSQRERERERESKEEKKEILTLGQEVLKYLNDRSGRNFSNTERNLKSVAGRVNDGNRLEQKIGFDQFKGVIDFKLKQSRDNPDKFDPMYLRPETLFSATNFFKYLDEARYRLKHPDSTPTEINPGTGAWKKRRPHG